MAQRKRTSNVNKKFTKKSPKVESLSDLSSKNGVCNKISNCAQLENKITDNEKNFLNRKKFKCDAKKQFHFEQKADETLVQSSSSRLTNQLPKSSSNVNFISNLKSVIDKVKNLKMHPSVQIYSVMPKGKGISAADVSHSMSHFAYSFSHSCEICLCSRKNLSDAIAGDDLSTTWLSFVSAKNQLIEDKESKKVKPEYFSSPNQYIIRHNDDVSGLRFASDDNLLFSCSLDGSVKAISTTAYRVVENYDGCGLFTDIDVNSLATQFVVTNDLSWNPFYVSYLYNFERKSPILCFSGHNNTLKCIRYHPNGLYIATASSDKSLKLWNVRQSQAVRSFQDKGMDFPEKITFSPDGKYIASTYDTGCIKVWDIASGKKLKCLMTSNSDPCILNICYNSTGNMLAAGGSDKKIHFWNVMSNGSSEMQPDYDFLKTECLDRRIFCIKYVANFFSCVTG